MFFFKCQVFEFFKFLKDFYAPQNIIAPAIIPTCFQRCQDIAVRLKFNKDMTDI